MLDDAIIRAAFHLRRLRGVHQNPGTLVVDELGIDHGRQRADIAVINGRMTGYEIKSDLDTLDRLTKQIAGYNRVFDYAAVVATDRHLQQAAEMVPPWWGIISVTAGSRGGLHFRNVRRGSLNPRASAIALARLLWRDEVLCILRDLGIRGEKLRSERASLYRSLIRRMAVDDLAKLVRSRLKARTEWRDL
jgi:hypothetical protein